MARRWTKNEEREKYVELKKLYIKDNKAIGKIAKILNISQSSVYDRLLRLNIQTQPFKKLHYKNKQYYVKIPKIYSNDLAEFIGIMLGDGHISRFQVTVTLGTKEYEYVNYVSRLINKVFKTQSKVTVRKSGYKTVYVGSIDAVKWLKDMGLAHNKVNSQFDVPAWILERDCFIKNTLRGLIDTDGSIYKLRFGIQISFCNRSMPLLATVRNMFVKLGYHPSRISGYNLYLTKREDVLRFGKEIGFHNSKHQRRFLEFIKKYGYVV